LTLTTAYDFDGHSPSLLYRMSTVIAALSNAPTDLAPASKDDSFSYVHGPGIDDHRSRGWLVGDCHRQPSGRDERERTSQLLVKTTTSGSVYYHHDGLGSTVALTDAAGAKIESYTYDVFGTVSIFDAAGFLQSSSTAGNRFLFTGRDHRSRGRLGGDCHRQPAGRDERERASQLITELNLYDYRNRIFSSELGRFLQTDPIRFEAGDVNLCGYASNSPANAVDPLGLISSVHTGPPAAAAAGWPPADIAETFGLSAAAAEALVKAQECKQLKSEVDSAKSDANRQGGCKKSDCPDTLKKKADAWKRLADARWNFNQKCWSGGDKGHQQAQQDAYRAWKKCNEILAKK
jgi:RHS repeat-associated protein